MSKPKYETCSYVESIGAIAVYVNQDCPNATMIKGHLVSSKERCRKCKTYKAKENECT